MNEAVGLTARVRVLPLDRMRGAPAIALDVHLNDGGLVNEAIDGGERHGGVAETKVPLFVSGSCLTSRSRTRIIFCLSTG